MLRKLNMRPKKWFFYKKRVISKTQQENRTNTWHVQFADVTINEKIRFFYIIFVIFGNIFDASNFYLTF